MIKATATCTKTKEKRQSNDAETASVKLKAMIFFHTLNIYQRIDALSESRSGFLC